MTEKIINIDPGKESPQYLDAEELTALRIEVEQLRQLVLLYQLAFSTIANTIKMAIPKAR